MRRSPHRLLKTAMPSGRTKGALGAKTLARTSLTGDIAEEDEDEASDGADGDGATAAVVDGEAAPDEDADIRTLVLQLSRDFKTQGQDIKSRLARLESPPTGDPLDNASGGPRLSPNSSIAGSSYGSKSSAFGDAGSLLEILGEADPDYSHCLDRCYISRRFQVCIRDKSKTSAWGGSDLSLLNSTSLLARTNAAAIEVLSHVNYTSGPHQEQVDNALAGLYTAEAHMRQTLGLLQLRLQADAKTSTVVWDSARRLEEGNSQNAAFGTMPFAMPSITRIMQDITRKAAESALRDHQVSLSCGGAAGAAPSKKAPRHATTDDDDEVAQLKTELKNLKFKNGNNEKRLKGAKTQLKAGGLTYEPPLDLHQHQTAAKTPKPKTAKPTKQPATEGDGGQEV